MNAKKQQQLKKLEEIASKYKERSQRDKEEKTNINDRSQIPIPKKINLKNNLPQLKVEQSNEDEKTSITVVQDTVIKDVEVKGVRKNKTVGKTNNSLVKEKEVIEKKKVSYVEKKKIVPKKETKKIKLVKETSMSLDSLEDGSSASRVGDKNCQSIGINTELMCPCIPCVIYDNLEQKLSSRKSKSNDKNVTKVIEEPKVELLYKNLTMVSSCDIQAKVKTEIDTDLKDDVIDTNLNISLNNAYDNNNSDDSVPNIRNNMMKNNVTTPKANKSFKNRETVCKPNHDLQTELDLENVHDLSAENYEENYEHDLSHESDNSIGDKYDNQEENYVNDIVCRHGSGDTYTKFTENASDLEEFINLTDKMMSNHYNEEKFKLEKDVESLHTPKTNSLEAINDLESDSMKKSEPLKYTFSDSFQELKNDLMHLMENGGEQILKTEDVPNPEANRKVCDMEHITVYQLKFYDEQKAKDNVDTDVKDNKSLKNVTSEFKLPSISETNKPERKLACNKSRMQKIYKPTRKFKMLGEQDRTKVEYQTFIVKENEDDKSDEQSITSEAPPLKLPRIENKRLKYYYSFLFYSFSLQIPFIHLDT